MVVVSGGRTNYGEAIGILMLDTKFPRVPGDIGNASTFDFPVRYKIVKGASAHRVIFEADPKLLGPFITAGKELVKEASVKAITTSGGFLAIFQKEMAEALPVPVFTSSLMQVPLVYGMIGKKKVGVLTAHKASLTERHFKSVGVEGIPIAIEGMDDKAEFKRIINDQLDFDVEKVKAEVVEAAKQLVSENPDVGAIVFECTNFPPFARAVQEATNLPIFDIVTLTKMVYDAVVRKPFTTLFY